MVLIVVVAVVTGKVHKDYGFVDTQPCRAIHPEKAIQSWQVTSSGLRKQK